MNYPKAIEQLIEALRSYPGVGKKTAERYALFTVNRMTDEQIDAMIDAFEHIKTDIFPCPVCGNIIIPDSAGIHSFAEL